MGDAVVYPVAEGSLIVLKALDFADSVEEGFVNELIAKVGHDRFLVLAIPEEGHAEVIGPDELKDRLREALAG